MDIQEVEDIDISESDIIADLLAEYPVMEQQPEDWINAMQAANVWNVSRETARIRLEKLAKQGIWERRTFYSDNNQNVVCYRKKD